MAEQQKAIGTTLLTNIEYDFLFNLGGDNLVSFFATLRFHKEGIVIKKIGRKGIVATINALTGLSRTAINKYLKALLDVGLVLTHPNGNIAVRGRKWTFKHLPALKRRKLLPLEVYNKFTDTKMSSRYIRVHSNLKSQKSQIEKRTERIKLMEELTSGSLNKLSDLKQAKRLEKDGLIVADLAESRLNSTLSNLGFDKLIRPSENKNTKSAGNYHKRKMLSSSLIHQKRVIELRYPGIKDKKFAKELTEDEDFNGGAFVTSKGIFIEISPEISIPSLTPLSRFKKKASKRRTNGVD